jgi:hypothetical protein
VAVVAPAFPVEPVRNRLGGRLVGLNGRRGLSQMGSFWSKDRQCNRHQNDSSERDEYQNFGFHLVPLLHEYWMINPFGLQSYDTALSGIYRLQIGCNL